MAVIIIVIVLLLIVGWGVFAYNHLVRFRNQVASGWSQISVQLERRHDLIPNLIETVKGYAAHESSTFEAVVAARNQAMAATAQGPEASAQAENVLTGTLKSLFALSESYPDLKASTNFLALQEELTSTEDRVAYARQFYNDRVLAYNNRRQIFPSSLIAGMGGFQPAEFFQVENSAVTEVPQVKFT